DLQAVGVGTLRPRLVAAEEQHSMDAVFARSPAQEGPKLIAVENASRRDVRHRIEAGVADRGDRLQRARERQARQRWDVDAATGGKERAHVRRAMQLAR